MIFEHFFRGLVLPNTIQLAISTTPNRDCISLIQRPSALPETRNRPEFTLCYLEKRRRRSYSTIEFLLDPPQGHSLDMPNYCLPSLEASQLTLIPNVANTARRHGWMKAHILRAWNLRDQAASMHEARYLVGKERG